MSNGNIETLPIAITITKNRNGYDFFFDGDRSVVDDYGNIDLRNWRGRKKVKIVMTITERSPDDVRFLTDPTEVIYFCRVRDLPGSGCPPSQKLGSQFKDITVDGDGTVLSFINKRSNYKQYAYGLFFKTKAGSTEQCDPRIENGDDRASLNSKKLALFDNIDSLTIQNITYTFKK